MIKEGRRKNREEQNTKNRKKERRMEEGRNLTDEEGKEKEDITEERNRLKGKMKMERAEVFL